VQFSASKLWQFPEKLNQRGGAHPMERNRNWKVRGARRLVCSPTGQGRMWVTVGYQAFMCCFGILTMNYVLDKRNF
jgi:hypothetical protein